MNSALNTYKKNQVQTNTPEKLVLMLYDGAIKFIGKSIKEMEENNPQNTHNYLIRSQDILVELMSGINFDVGEISENLFNLYEYMHYQLQQANMKKDKEIAENVLNMLKELRDTWLQMINENRTNLHKKTASL